MNHDRNDVQGINDLLDLEKTLDAVANEHNLLPPPAHTIKGERFNGGETRFVCTCGATSKPARGKVTARRINRHTFKTGHQWEPSS
jgi:hypothetical protein